MHLHPPLSIIINIVRGTLWRRDREVSWSNGRERKSPGPAFCCLAEWNELHPVYSSCRRCILNAPALCCPHSHVLQLPGHGLPLHPVRHVCVCVCLSKSGCICASSLRTLFLFLCASAFPHRRHRYWYEGRRRPLPANSKFWCISGEATLHV